MSVFCVNTSKAKSLSATRACNWRGGGMCRRTVSMGAGLFSIFRIAPSLFINTGTLTVLKSVWNPNFDSTCFGFHSWRWETSEWVFVCVFQQARNAWLLPPQNISITNSMCLDHKWKNTLVSQLVLLFWVLSFRSVRLGKTWSWFGIRTCILW